jgi:hypothetical protein
MNRSPSKLTLATMFAFACSLALGAFVLVRGSSSASDERTRPTRVAPITAGAGASRHDWGSGSASFRSATPRPALAARPEPAAAPAHRGPAEYRAQLSARLKAEPSDPTWAARSLNDVRQRMSHLSTPGLDLLGVECGSTLCALDFKLQAADAMTSLKRTAIDFPWPTTGFVSHREDDPTRVVMFVARKGHSLPNPPADGW